MPEIDPYEPWDRFDNSPGRLAARNREINRVFALDPNDAFAELLQLHLRREHASEEQDQRILRQIALLAEGLSKWWYERGGRSEHTLLDDDDR